MTSAAPTADVAVVGAGAAGLFCAATAGGRGKNVLVLEAGEKPGRKILISGGGRCNFTNTGAAPANYLSANPHFCKSALSRYRPDDFVALLKKHGVPFHEKKAGQLFCDRSARDVLNVLTAECAAARVRIVTGCRVNDASKDAAGTFKIATSRGEFRARALVVACGGLTVPKISSDAGYRLARRFGLGVTELKPALVPFIWNKGDAADFSALPGISLEVEARVKGASFRDDLLFTHQGLSGPAALQISSYWRAGGELTLDLMPGRDAAGILLTAKRQGVRKTLKNFLARDWPGRFAATCGEKFGGERSLHEIADAELKAIGARINAWRLNPAGTLGYEKAEVTLGGVDTKDLSSKTMAATAVPGLFFIGEAVDVTGWLGGYNFQWAWSSGHVAGQAV